MKIGFMISSVLLLSGCMFGASQEIQRAEDLLARFQCLNVETHHVAHSAMTTYHQQSLAASREKAEDYLKRYKEGDYDLHLPLSEMIEEQYQKYHAACQSLGGLPIDAR